MGEPLTNGFELQGPRVHRGEALTGQIIVFTLDGATEYFTYGREASGMPETNDAPYETGNVTPLFTGFIREISRLDDQAMSEG